MSKVSLVASFLVAFARLDPGTSAAEPTDRVPVPGAGRVLALAQAEPAVKKARPVRTRPAFVPLDLKRKFTAGPLSDPRPPSTLLPTGATTVELTLKAAVPTVCRYSVGNDLPFEQMTPFDARQPAASPNTVVRGLDPDPARVNDVFIRSAEAPGLALHLQYRSLPATKPGFPRTANLWGSGRYPSKGMEYASRIDLWLGARFDAGQIRQLRRLNPNTLVLTDINTVENNDVPDDYFLRDTTGRKIEVWPGAFRLNLTRPEVADYQARYAYQRMLDSGLRYDGCFFDNFMTSQSWQVHDIYDRPVQLDGDGDGKPDDPQTFDRKWREGVFRELREWRKLMPWALTTGHSQGYPRPEIAELFNGQGIGFYTTDVIEGKHPFHELWDYYHAWCSVTVKPPITSVESAVPDQIAYGYDYNPQRHTPASTWKFARDYYPYMRFGLAFTLMDDGYFSHELGDTDHGQDWWYDELDHKLGAPLGPARRVVMGHPAEREEMANGGFEEPLEETWSLWCDRDRGCAATAVRDTAFVHSGTAAARISVTGPGRPGGIEFSQPRRSLEQGKSYDLRLWARADRPMQIRAISSKSTPDWDNYGLSQEVRLTTRWQPITLTFEARLTVHDARIQLLCGGEAGTIWVDDISLKEHGEEVYRRDFENGVVLLNGTRSRQSIDVGPGLARISGGQAPRFQYLLDDRGGPGFKTTGDWHEIALGTKEWHAIPPYYHAWNNRCHTLAAGPGQATWDLDLRGPGSYTIQAWWAAAPTAEDWTGKAIYEVLAGGKVVASRSLDQTQAGDEWHTVAEGLRLEPGDHPIVRIRNEGRGILVADALHVSSAERYNDGEPASRVTLEPMDGIVLRRAASALTPAERMAPSRLKAAHEDVVRIHRLRQELPKRPGLNDYRAILHAHAEDSSHTGGTRPEMLAEAKRADVHAILLSDHHRPPRDFMTQSWRGQKDGVLFIPGSEDHGFLLYPTRSVMGHMADPPARFIDAVRADGGLIFLSHIEERVDHPTEGLDGMEIYNRHADAKKDEAGLLAFLLKLTSPALLREAEQSLRDYPDELFAAQVEYPADYLAKWDRETGSRRLTGVAANDCHHNMVMIAKMVSPESVRVGTIVDKEADMQTVSALLRPGIRELTRGHRPGDVVARLDLDPYHRSFRNVSTHILAPGLSEAAIRDALRQGHAYVCHDWMCDPTGFQFDWVPVDAEASASHHGMGDEVKPGSNGKLVARFPVSCHIRLMWNGKVIADQEGDRLEREVTEPGVYRIEGWLSIGGEDRGWLYANPVYVR